MKKEKVFTKKNALDQLFKVCCYSHTKGYCRTDENDYGKHIICVQMIQQFLEFTKSCGNDLSTLRSELDFPGLQSGKRWYNTYVDTTSIHN